MNPQTKPPRKLTYRDRVLAGQVKPKPRTRIRAVAKKRVARNAEYAKLRREFLAEHPFCQVRGCGSHSCDVHHKARRGRFLLRVDTFLSCCRDHHTKIEENPEWAKANGYLLTPEQRRILLPYP